MVSLVFLGEKFTWVKLLSVLFCMAGTIIVSLGDSETGLSAVSSKPLLGDILALVSAGLYAVYITLIRLKLPDNDGKSGHASMAQFLGYLGLFNVIIFLPVALVLDLTNLEPFCKLTWKQFGLIVGKGLYFCHSCSVFGFKALLLVFISKNCMLQGYTYLIPLLSSSLMIFVRLNLSNLKLCFFVME